MSEEILNPSWLNERMNHQKKKKEIEEVDVINHHPQPSSYNSASQHIQQKPPSPILAPEPHPPVVQEIPKYDQPKYDQPSQPPQPSSQHERELYNPGDQGSFQIGGERDDDQPSNNQQPNQQRRRRRKQQEQLEYGKQLQDQVFLYLFCCFVF